MIALLSQGFKMYDKWVKLYPTTNQIATPFFVFGKLHFIPTRVFHA